MFMFDLTKNIWFFVLSKLSKVVFVVGVQVAFDHHWCGVIRYTFRSHDSLLFYWWKISWLVDESLISSYMVDDYPHGSVMPSTNINAVRHRTFQFLVGNNR